MRSEKVVLNLFRTGVRLPSPPPKKSTFVDTKKSSLYEVTFLFAIAVNPLFTRVFGFFSFCAVFNAVPENLLVSHCCFVLAFIVRYFETSSYLGGFTQNIKSCTGSRLYNTSSKTFFNCTPYIYMQQSRHQNGP